MRFRAAHFACLLLLLSALGAADASALTVGARAAAARSVAAARQSAVATQSAIAAAKAGDTRSAGAALPVAARTQQRTVWAIRPPASHSIVLQAVTGSGR